MQRLLSPSRAPLLLFAVAMSCQRAPTSSPPVEDARTPTATPPLARLEHPGCFEIVALDGDAPPQRHEATAGECRVATVPASTFKIPHALVALQTGVVTDPEKLERWDGSKYWLKTWERDHSLRTAIEESVVWFFQGTAEAIGPERMRDHLAALDYGNAKVEGPIREFWLAGGSLEITPDEQLDFVARMFTGKLTSIDRAHVATVESIMQSDLARWQPRVPADFAMPSSTATFWAKTGTDEVDGLRMTWWMGAIEGPRGRFAFVSRVRDEGELGAVSPAVTEGITALERFGVL
jgi:beta-lactamase class D